ncbi:MAG: hypothetical protein RMK60_04305 [Burkholderiales bacterium]|nr:hypothetical protein [Burkholderiales bacterium]
MVRSLSLSIALLLVLRALAGPVETRLPSGAGLISEHFQAAGPPRAVLLWYSGQYGRIEAEQRAAADLAGLGFEVWLADWLAPYFLPPTASSLQQVPEEDLAAWLQAAVQAHPQRPVVLLASGHAALLPLRAAAAWRARAQAPAQPAGAVLLFPILYQDPEPGEEPEYDPVVARTRLDLVLLFPQHSAGHWWRDALQAAFAAAGSRTRGAVLPSVRDRFHHRADANADEQQAAARLGELLAAHILSLLDPESVQ